jgi:cytochrome P450
MDWITPNLRIGEFWREGRKLLDRSLRAGALPSYRPMMQEKTRWFLAQLFSNPNELHRHIELLLCRLFISYDC